jgi:sec-independent protein translocase protein TatA
MLLITLLFLSNPKTIIFIVFILVLFFGAKRIPELFRGVGQGVREFKDASTETPRAPSQAYNNQPVPPQGQPGQYNQYNGQPQPGYNQPAQYGQPNQPYGQPNPGYNQSAPGQVPPTTPPASYNPNNSQAS